MVKAFVYLESDNAAMGIVRLAPSPIEMDRAFVRRIENAGGNIDADDEPNQRFTEEEKRIPMAWRALPGDVLIFDERLYHNGLAGRGRQGHRQPHRSEVLPVAGVRGRQPALGADVLLLPLRPQEPRLPRPERGFPPEPADRGLVLSNGWGNYYEQSPQDLRHAFLTDPDTLEPLIEEFSAGRRVPLTPPRRSARCLTPGWAKRRNVAKWRRARSSSSLAPVPAGQGPCSAAVPRARGRIPGRPNRSDQALVVG